MSTIAGLNRSTKILSAVAAAYSIGVVIWFFSAYAHRINSQPLDLLSPMAMFGAIAAIPYAALWLAQQVSRSRKASRFSLLVTMISGASSLLLYLPAFLPDQDGEFAVMFYLGFVQLALAVACCIYALTAQEQGPA
ncbi:MAG: hypothetical protein IT529_06115 [Burkholderiales bacterium]|nr:hypothetical protein [Burkholderiales bacterium]